MRRESRSRLPEFLHVNSLSSYTMVTKLRKQQTLKNSKTYKIIIGKQQVKRTLVRPRHRWKTSNKPFNWPNSLRRRAEIVLRTRQWTGWLHKAQVAFFVCFWRNSLQWARASSFTRFLDHTQRRTTVGRTPLDDWLARSKDLYLTTHHTHNRQTSMPPVGFAPTIS